MHYSIKVQKKDLSDQMQVAPLSVTPLGGGLAEPLPTKPMVTEAPARSVWLQLGAAARNLVLSWVTVAFHPLTSVTPAGTFQEASHGTSARLPVFVMVTAAW